MISVQPTDTSAPDLSEAIVQQILMGVYPPGAKLKEAELAVRFQAGRSQIREALRRLEERGIATLVTNAGMSVVRVGWHEFLECAAARLALETQTASEAARNVDEGGLRYIMDMLRKQEVQLSGAAEQANSFGSAATDANFHRAIAEASGNSFIARLLDNKIFFMNRLFQMEHPGLPSRAALAVEEHQQIARAIEERDSEVASLKMRRHLTRSTAWYLEQIDRRPKESTRRNGLRSNKNAPENLS